jgi:hypothetical protein
MIVVAPTLDVSIIEENAGVMTCRNSLHALQSWYILWHWIARYTVSLAVVSRRQSDLPVIIGAPTLNTAFPGHAASLTGGGYHHDAIRGSIRRKHRPEPRCEEQRDE